MWEIWVQSLGQEDPLEKGWQTTPVFLPGESHGQRSLAGYSPWGRKESGTNERLPFSFSFFSLSPIPQNNPNQTTLDSVQLPPCFLPFMAQPLETSGFFLHFLLSAYP